MKTIEEKAKAYDEAIKQLRIMMPNWENLSYNGKTFLQDLVHIFPELEEDGDEMIRKDMLEYCNKRMNNEFPSITIHQVKRWLAWLEKQGEQQGVSIQINPSEYINDMGGNGCYLKSTDKIGPKFKEGDWVVYENRVGLIIRMLKEHYIISFDGVKEQVSFTFNDRITKWTIQDAKDGDVLCDYSEAYDNPLIFILKKFECVNFGLVRPSDYSSYCFLTAGDIQRFKEGTYHHKHNIEPATKEQRDLLFKKMKEAGYEWSDKDRKLIKGTYLNTNNYESKICK